MKSTITSILMSSCLLSLNVRRQLPPPTYSEIQRSMIVTVSVVVFMFQSNVGMVLNGEECIPQAQCPCHYHGKPYSEGMRIQQDCRTWYVTKSL